MFQPSASVECGVADAYQLAVEVVEGAPRKMPSARCRKCQVPGCCADLASEGKQYCLRRQICRKHMQAEAVECDAKMLRFCMQCGKMEPLSCFDGMKRSCRAKLNKRREHKSHMAQESRDPPAMEALLMQQLMCPADAEPRSSLKFADAEQTNPMAWDASSSEMEAAAAAARPFVLPAVDAVGLCSAADGALEEALVYGLRRAAAEAAGTKSSKCMQHNEAQKQLQKTPPAPQQQLYVQPNMFGLSSAGLAPPAVAMQPHCCSSLGGSAEGGLAPAAEPSVNPLVEELLQQLLTEELNRIPADNQSSSLTTSSMGSPLVCNMDPGAYAQLPAGCPRLLPELVSPLGLGGAPAAPAPVPAAFAAAGRISAVPAAPAAAAGGAVEGQVVRLQRLQTQLLGLREHLKSLEAFVHCWLPEGAAGRSSNHSNTFNLDCFSSV